MIAGIVAAQTLSLVASGDPHWSSVVSLLQFGGADGATTFTDAKSVVWTPAGNAQIDVDAGYPGGRGLLLDGNNDYLSATAAGFAFGTADATMEWWLRRSGNSAGGGAVTDTVVDLRTAEPSSQISIYITGSSRALVFYVNGVARISSSSSAISGSDQHIEWSRVSGVSRLFIDGIQVGSSWADSTNYTSTTMYLGGRFAAVSGDRRSLNGVISQHRVTAVGRHSTNFTPPPAPFPTA